LKSADPTQYPAIDPNYLASRADVQVLIDAEPKPGAGKRERRPRDRLQLEHVAIEGHAPLDVGNVNGNVIELTDEHEGRSQGIMGNDDL